MRLFSLLLSLLSLHFGALAQRSWGVELGTLNALSYTTALGSRWAVDIHGGMEFDRLSNLADGISPVVSLESRWSFVSDNSGAYYRQGGYWGLNVFARFPELSPIGRGGRLQAYPKTDVSLVFAPTLGWLLPINERSYIRVSLALAFVWDRFRFSSGFIYWESSAGNNRLPLLIQAVYGFRF